MTESQRAEQALRLVTELISIPGRSGSESQVAEAIRRVLLGFGVPATAFSNDDAHLQSPIGGDCGNLIVDLPGTLDAPRRLLMAHMDTVPLCVGARPNRKGDRIVPEDASTGLGADNRAGVAVVLSTAVALLENKVSHPPLTLFFPVQEEIGLVGARYADVKRLGHPALCFNWDGGDPDRVILGATGAYALEIVVRGIASHAGVHPEAGVSAIAIAAHAITELNASGWHGLIRKGTQLGTSNIGVVEGGEATNVVMPELRLRAEARSHDPEFRKQIVGEFQNAFNRAAAHLRNADGESGIVELSAELRYESFRLDPEAQVVSTAAAALRRTGLTPNFVVANGGLDANWMTAHGLPTVTLGCGQHDIHTVKESLHVGEFLKACDVALDLATGGHTS